jgi:hypothetical protein
MVELLKRTQLEGQEQIGRKAGNQHQGHKPEIAHNDLLLQLFFIPVLQKRIADNKGYERKENVQRKRIIREDGIRKPLEIVCQRIRRGFGQAFPTDISSDHEQQQKVQNTHGYGTPALESVNIV